MDDEKESNTLDVKDALEMLELCKTAWEENYKQSRIDLKMAIGERDVQWGAEWDTFTPTPGQPYVVINQLPQFIHQVTNDIRQNTPSIKIIPDVDANEATAEAMSELIRAIEYKSNADEVYDTAAQYSVTCGIGFIRVDHGYCDDRTGNQEIKIVRVNDPLSVYIDPSSMECDGRDANYAIALESITRKQFKKKYGNKEFVSFTDPKAQNDKKDEIILGEVFIKEVTGEAPNDTITIRRYKCSGHEILEQTVFPGRYIPIIPVYGVETWVEQKRVLQSLIRQAREAQRRLNHWASKESQILSMGVVAPILAARNTIVNERGQYQKSGSETVLEYDPYDDQDRPVSPPGRLAPPSVPAGFLQAQQSAKENIKESMGMYNASIGQRSNETSGVAIQRRQQEGDVATFHFADNLRRSITQCGRVIVSMVPTIYDTPRVLQLIDNETNPKMMGVNGAMVEGQEDIIDLTKGIYHVRVTTGASYTTKRQETTAFLADMFKMNPELMKIGGDIFFKNVDMAGSEAMAERFAKILPPELREDKEQQDPAVLAANQQLEQAKAIIQQMQQQMQQMEQQLKSKETETQAKVQDTQTKAEVEVMKMQQATEQSKLEYQIKQMELQSKQEELKGNKAIKIAELQLKAQELQLKAQEMMQPKEQAMQEGVEQEDDGQEMQMKMMQTQAVLEAIGSIKQSLDGLTSAVSTPKRVAYDDNGNIVGVLHRLSTTQKCMS